MLILAISSRLIESAECKNCIKNSISDYEMVMRQNSAV